MAGSLRCFGSVAVLLGAGAVLSACGGGDAGPPVTSITAENAVAYSKKLTLVVSGVGLDTANISLTTQGCQGMSVLPGGTPERQRVACTVTGPSQVSVTAKLADGTELLSNVFPVPQPKVELQTTQGNVVLELFPNQAPATVFNFLGYVNSGFYHQTLLHRVVPGFVVQGGGYGAGLAAKKPAGPAIPLETPNGLLNLRGTLGMIRGSAPQSATSEFYVNLKDNPSLDHANTTSPGYAVFARVSDGMAVFDTLSQAATGAVGSLGNVPLVPVVLTQTTQLQ